MPCWKIFLVPDTSLIVKNRTHLQFLPSVIDVSSYPTCQVSFFFKTNGLFYQGDSQLYHLLIQMLVSHTCTLAHSHYMGFPAFLRFRFDLPLPVVLTVCQCATLSFLSSASRHETLSIFFFFFNQHVPTAWITVGQSERSVACVPFRFSTLGRSVDFQSWKNLWSLMLRTNTFESRFRSQEELGTNKQLLVEKQINVNKDVCTPWNNQPQDFDETCWNNVAWNCQSIFHFPLACLNLMDQWYFVTPLFRCYRTWPSSCNGTVKYTKESLVAQSWKNIV